MKTSPNHILASLSALALGCAVAADTDGALYNGDVPGQTNQDDEDDGADDGDDGADPGDDGDDGDDGTGGGDDGGDDGGEENAVCGNGVLEAGEACDGENFGGTTCGSMGFDSGELACDANCQSFTTDTCFTCGNGVVEGPETCDGEVPPLASCETEGYTGGSVTCNVDTCQLDLRDCTECGNDVIEGDETCDGQDLAGLDCQAMGYESGDLECLVDTCAYNVASCIPFEYREDFEGGTLGNGWITDGNAFWTVTDTDALGGGFSAQSGLIIDGAQSNLKLTLEFMTDGEITFTHQESTESFDTLTFYVDGEVEGSWGGVTGAREETIPVVTGSHTFEWVYLKDLAGTAGDDVVRIDDVHVVGGRLPQ